jgi:hypothetical protein
MSDVRGFFGDYRFLSNFYKARQVVNGIEYISNEHFFQASKSTNQQDHDWVNSSETPGIAKHRGKRIPRREDWNKIRLDIMRLGLLAKFSQNLYLKDLLLGTGSSYLEELNDWGDTFWGTCSGKGDNHLGLILMDLRDKFRIEELYG